MDDLLGESERALKARIETFVREQLAPLEQSLPGDSSADVPEVTRRAVVSAARAAGLYALLQPQDSGSGPTAVERVVVVETLARANLRVTRYALGPGPGMLAGVRGALREHYLLPLLAGEKRSALAITEPREPETRTRASHEGAFLCIRGRKSYVTGGAEADFFVVLVETTAAGGGTSARRFVIVDRDTKGLVIERRFQSLDGSHHVQLAFEDARVPVDRVLPEPQPGMTRAQAGLTEMRMLVAARATGAAAFAIDHVQERVREPDREGRTRGEDTGTRLRLADMCMALFAARSVLYRAARVLASGEDARNQAAAVKVLCTESATRIVSEAIAQTGGRALVQGHPLERVHRELQASLLTEGASDVLRQSFAKGVLEHGFTGF